LSDTPIGDHAMLSDCHSAALVDRAGSVVWWCVPRFDSASVFGRLLDEDAGHFSIEPTAIRTSRRRYLDDSLTLESRFDCDSGRLTMTDTLAIAEGVRGHDLGEGSPHRLLRNPRCESGTVELRIEFRPRTEYGLTTPVVEAGEGGVIAKGGPVTLVLSADVVLDIPDSRDSAIGTVTLGGGDQLAMSVEYCSSWKPPPPMVDGERIRWMIDDTTEAWRSWGRDHQRYTGPFSDEVALAGRILQGLTYVPTGAIVASPTTSLPETIGGSRNWDYRYAWVRDASFTMDALWVAACPDEERQFFDFLRTAASTVYHRDQIQIMFGVEGERVLVEHDLPWLTGWRDSRPVRVGNGAWNQRQNDVYGELLAAAHKLRDGLPFEDPGLRRMLIALADLATHAWDEPDHGIWEMRDEPRHHLYSKLMCWVALDRAIDMATQLEATDRIGIWKSTKHEIRQAILDRGWSEEAGAFTQSFGSTNLDASALVMPIVGFLPPDDQRVLATIEAIETHLMDESGLLMRYTGADGLEGEEGAFLLCTFWLAHAHALVGSPDRAYEVFTKATKFANDVGLFSEEVEVATGDLVGNFPQGFSHIGLVNAAWAIHQAEQS
jgi:GH15 family glucan-1,4-alpha-glucosidase